MSAAQVDYRAIAYSWRDICSDSAVDSLAFAHLFIHGAMDVLCAEDAFCALVGRESEDATDPVDGWRIVRMWHVDDRPGRLDDVRAFAAQGAYANDPHSQAVMAGAGTVRALLRADAVTASQWQSCPSRSMLESLGVFDQLVVGIPVSETCEWVLGASRMRDEPFTSRDRDTALVWLDGLTEQVKRLAACAGLFPALLTPREQQVFEGLLGDGSERVIAQQMDISTRTLHHHVTRVYRKFGVNSRPALMAQWLTLGECAK